jgi:archaellum component FlaC
MIQENIGSNKKVNQVLDRIETIDRNCKGICELLENLEVKLQFLKESKPQCESSDRDKIMKGENVPILSKLGSINETLIFIEGKIKDFINDIVI